MRFCPQCRGEFQDWVEVCIDCGVPLVDTRPEPAPKPKKEPKVVVPAESLVTVATFSYPLEAHLSRAKLESEGIDAVVADEHVVNANWLYSIAVGGVKLWVRESDAEKAAGILGNIPADIPGETEASGEIADDERCTWGKSVNIRYETFHIRPLFLFWFLMAFFFGYSGFTLPFLKRKWKCNSCGYQWKEAKEKAKKESL